MKPQTNPNSIILAFVMVLCSFSSMAISEPSGQLTLSRHNDALMVFTQWHFVAFNMPDGKLENLEFTAHVLPIFEVQKRVSLNLDQYEDQVIVMRAFESTRMGQNQYMAKAEIKINDAIITGYFLYGKANGSEEAIEGHFETEDNLIVPGMMGEDINYVLRAKVSHGSLHSNHIGSL